MTELILQLTTRQKTIGRICLWGLSFVVLKFIGRIPAMLLMMYFMSGDRISTAYTVVSTIPRDSILIYRFVLALLQIRKYEKRNASVGEVFEEHVKKHPNKKAMIMGEESFTFSQANKFSNQIASVFKENGFQKGDCVALLMQTQIEYPFVWLGLSKIGVETALVNFNLRKDPLIHSIRTVNSKAIIVSAELKEAIGEIRDHPDIKDIPIYQFNSKDEKAEFLPSAADLRTKLEEVSIQTKFYDPTFSTRDRMIYIYTSGTTGMPKAAVIPHSRYMLMSTVVHYVEGVSTTDTIYNPLPLYHSAGGMAGLGNVLLKGVTMAVRKKFSASNYWLDCIKYDCTVAQYVGELCRFLLAQPPRPEDKKHKVKLMFGNGVRPQIWEQFVARFGVHQIGEWYGATEGNCSLININHVPGSVGFMPKIVELSKQMAIIRCDDDGEPIRGENGYCILCKAGEPGIIIGKIQKGNIARSFSGYSDKEATNKKILKNAFKDGDVYFNSGDVLVKDIFNTFYFKDRTGDTFRWRGENVSCCEVEGVVSNVAGLKDSTVYGVEVPHCEGKAGMAAIMDPDNQLDIEKFSVGIKDALPAYARPLFIRVMPDVPMTSTFKVVKKDLLKEGFDIAVVKDPIYFLHADGVYRQLTQDFYEKILSGNAKL